MIRLYYISNAITNKIFKCSNKYFSLNFIIHRLIIYDIFIITESPRHKILFKLYSFILIIY